MRWIERVRGDSNPLGKEAVIGIGGTCLAAIGLWPAFNEYAPEPSAELLRYLAALGGTFLIAFAVELSAIVRELRQRGTNQAELVGVITGIGACGFLGIFFSLALSERAALGHWAALDEFAFAFAATSLLFLGGMIVLLPLLAYERLGAEHRNSDDD